MPNRKTNPLNSFFLFCQDYRKSIAVTNPELTNSEVSSQLGELWRKLDSKTKKSYVERAKKERNIFKKDNPDYVRQPKNAEFSEYTFSFKVQPLNTPIKKPSQRHPDSIPTTNIREQKPTHRPQRTISHSPPPVAYQPPIGPHYSYPPHPNYPPVNIREYPIHGNYYLPTPQEFSDVNEIQDLLFMVN